MAGGDYKKKFCYLFKACCQKWDFIEEAETVSRAKTISYGQEEQVKKKQKTAPLLPCKESKAF